MGESQTGQADLSSPRAQTVSAQDGGRIVTWHQYSLPARPRAPARLPTRSSESPSPDTCSCCRTAAEHAISSPQARDIHSLTAF